MVSVWDAEVKYKCAHACCHALWQSKLLESTTRSSWKAVHMPTYLSSMVYYTFAANKNALNNNFMNFYETTDYCL